MFSSSDPKTSSNTTRITSIVQSHVDTFIDNIFDIYRSFEDTTVIKTLSQAAFTAVSICEAVEVAILRKRNTCTLFSRLNTDVIHSIFGIVLDADRIHDPNFPLFDLDFHRGQIYQLRRVSALWNRFLLSSPRYWQVLNIKSPPPTIVASLKRSGSVPLCIYCTRDATPSIPDQLGLELAWSATRVQTLRSVDPDAYSLCRMLLRTRTSTLQTLQLTGPQNPKRPIEPLSDFSVSWRIRHLTAVGWRPSPQGAMWLNGLKELVLHDLSKLDAEILLVLSACVGLERFDIQCAGRIDIKDVPGARVPSTITLPCLQVMDLVFGSDEAAASLIRRLVTPQLLRASLDVGNAHLSRYHAYYCHFMSQAGGDAQYPTSPTITIEDGDPGYTYVVYETEDRRFTFDVLSTEAQAQAFHDLIQEFHGLYKGPSLTVKSMNSSRSNWMFLKSLGDQNVGTIEAHLDEGNPEKGRPEVDGLLKAIGALIAGKRRPVPNTTTN